MLFLKFKTSPSKKLNELEKERDILKDLLEKSKSYHNKCWQVLNFYLAHGCLQIIISRNTIR